MKIPANVSLLTLFSLLFLSCTPTLELGDLRYIEAQRACLVINLNEVNEGFLEGPPPTETQLQDVRRKCEDIGYEWTYTSRGLAERVVILQQPGSASALVNPTERPDTESAPMPTDPLPGPEVPVDVSVEGGSPENPVVMTYSELKETLRGDDPWPAVEVLRDKWVQITGPTNGGRGRGGVLSDPETLVYSFTLSEFGVSSPIRSVAVRCWSKPGDTRIRDFETLPKREVTVMGVYQQESLLSPRLTSCQVVQDSGARR